MKRQTTKKKPQSACAGRRTANLTHPILKHAKNRRVNQLPEQSLNLRKKPGPANPCSPYHGDLPGSGNLFGMGQAARCPGLRIVIRVSSAHMHMLVGTTRMSITPAKTAHFC